MVGMCDVILVLEAEKELCCERRLHRRPRWGEAEVAAARAYFFEHVWPAHEQWLLPATSALLAGESASRTWVLSGKEGEAAVAAAAACIIPSAPFAVRTDISTA